MFGLTALGTLPLSWKLLGGVTVLLLIVIAFGVVYAKGRSDGSAACKAADAIAISNAQKKADATANELVIAQAAAMANNERQVTVYRDKVNNDPSTNGCGAALHDAADGVLTILGGSSAKSK